MANPIHTPEPALVPPSRAAPYLASQVHQDPDPDGIFHPPRA